jgi:hypothetical protein
MKSEIAVAHTFTTSTQLNTQVPLIKKNMKYSWPRCHRWEHRQFIKRGEAEHPCPPMEIKPGWARAHASALTTGLSPSSQVPLIQLLTPCFLSCKIVHML